jgi:hypothetical protein
MSESEIVEGKGLERYRPVAVVVSLRFLLRYPVENTYISFLILITSFIACIYIVRLFKSLLCKVDCYFRSVVL